jgi:hypothetical protein
MNRQDYIYQLAGRITDKKSKKKKDGTTFYQLSTVIKDKEIDRINIFSDSCKKEIWQEIEANKYLGQEYLFYCKNFMGSYYLVD